MRKSVIENYSLMNSNQVKHMISIVAPCYNEEEVLSAFCNRVIRCCEALEQSYELILVDDGSKDRTWSVIVELCQDCPFIIGVKLSRNHGHQLALTAGLYKSKGDYILIIDADLQDPPELLPEMLALMKNEGADVVYGRRRRRNGETIIKRATAFLFYRLLNFVSDTEIPQDTGDFRLISRRALDVFLNMNERHRYIRGMISWIGFKQLPIYYDRKERFAGKSKYPFLKMWNFALNAITSFSTKPLKIASWLGVGVSIIAFSMIFYTITMSILFNKTVPGWSSLVVVVLFLGAIQLFVLGIIGEYIGRLCMEIKHRPLYLVQEVYSSNPQLTSPESNTKHHQT